jgi:hypothetical protein
MIEYFLPPGKGSIAFISFKGMVEPSTVAHACNPSTWRLKILVRGQPGGYTARSCLWKKKKKKRTLTLSTGLSTQFSQSRLLFILFAIATFFLIASRSQIHP